MVIGNYTSSRNKNLNTSIRKHFRKSHNYVCCTSYPGNCNKEHRGFSCTNAKIYKRLDHRLMVQMALRMFEDD